MFAEVIRKCNLVRETPITSSFRDLDDVGLAEIYTSWIDYVKKVIIRMFSKKVFKKSFQ